jgi:hypothetical protein
MERAILWMKCAAMHDPVRPVQERPAAIGWEAKQRKVDLVIERPFTGVELLRRMKGWVTADVVQVTDLITKYGKLRVLNERDLIVETQNMEDIETISRELAQAFGEEVWIEIMKKNLLE